MTTNSTNTATNTAAQISSQISTYHTALLRFHGQAHDYQTTPNALPASQRLADSLISLWQACDALCRARADYVAHRTPVASFNIG